MRLISRIFILLLIFFTGNICHAQTKAYRIYFKDKSSVEFDPLSYFDMKAIERRAMQNLPLYDQSDLPLSENYVSHLKNNCDSLGKQSRWFNFIIAYADSLQRSRIKHFDFVSTIEEVNYPSMQLCEQEYFKSSLSLADTTVLIQQLNRMQADEFKKKNEKGQRIRIAIFDAGFTAVDKSPAFADIRKEFRIKKTWDFIRNHEYVYDHSAHGTEVLSCIGGSVNRRNIGMATDAEFLLARTERAKRETYSEEENWLEAVEWADKNGADIINSSLGYTYQRYFTKDMDGKKSLVSRAANMAARKGILVINSAGNEGSNKWKTLASPADADSVLTVGGIDPNMNYHISFSSYGPTADKRLKPNVCAYGDVIAAAPYGLKRIQGTSFSSPLIAGFAACAWQERKNMTNMELFREIEKSGDLYPYYDYAHGYGVPQANYFTDSVHYEVSSTFEWVVTKDQVKVEIKPAYLKLDRDNGEYFKEYLFYKITGNDGIIVRYAVIDVTRKNVLSLDKNQFTKGMRIDVVYKGYTANYLF